MSNDLPMLDEHYYIDTLLAFYGEQVEHARHHEVTRAESTNYILAASTALIGLLSADKIFGASWGPHGRIAIVCVILILNIYGILLSSKHYERNRLHAIVAGKYRSEISDRFARSGFTATNELRKVGHIAARKEYPFLEKIRLHWLWVALHILFIIIAVVLTQI